MRIGFLDGLDQLILAGGQVHGLDVEAFRLDLVVAADHHHRNVGLLLPRRRLRFSAFVARFGGVLRWILAFHTDAKSEVICIPLQPSPDSVERGDGVLGPNQRTASAAGARDGRVGSDHCDGLNLRGIERQQRVLVLQQHNAFRCSLECNLPLLRRVHFAARGVRMIEEAAERR